jgi:F0F1-type ATP synthase delta subunit
MPVHTDAVAQVYARSLFELAEQAGGRNKIVEVFVESFTAR